MKVVGSLDLGSWGLGSLILESWIVLQHCYTSGALTMFFTSDVALPFESLRDVLQKIPDWKLLSVKGLDAIYEIPASQVKFIFYYFSLTH